MALLGGFLVLAAPAGPGQDAGWLAGSAPGEADEEAADFGDGERDVDGASGAPSSPALTAKAANATKARVIWRCQPCRLRTS